jgi:hypothetical protein
VSQVGRELCTGASAPELGNDADHTRITPTKVRNSDDADANKARSSESSVDVAIMAACAGSRSALRPSCSCDVSSQARTSPARAHTLRDGATWTLSVAGGGSCVPVGAMCLPATLTMPNGSVPIASAPIA